MDIVNDSNLLFKRLEDNMNSSIQIGKIMGIPIKLHITFLLIIPVFGYIFGNNPPDFGFSDIEPLLLRYVLGLSVATPCFSHVSYYMNWVIPMLLRNMVPISRELHFSFLEVFLHLKISPEIRK